MDDLAAFTTSRMILRVGDPGSSAGLVCSAGGFGEGAEMCKEMRKSTEMGRDIKKLTVSQSG